MKGGRNPTAFHNKKVLLAAHYGDVCGSPDIIGDTVLTAIAAVGHGRLPKGYLVEGIEAIQRTALVSEQGIALASCRNNRNGPEPGSQISLQLWV